MTPELCEELLERTEAGIGAAAAQARRSTDTRRTARSPA
jgi:hypothetical protein